MRLEDFIRRADELIQAGQSTLKTIYQSHGYHFVNSSQFWSFRSGSLSFIGSCFGTDHPYYVDFAANVTSNSPAYVDMGLGILKALREELAGGWVVSTKSIVSAEIFSDFLDMASYLLREGYKDAAAIMIGGVLEEHLRQLSPKAGIALEASKSDGRLVPKKADTLNAELKKEGIYGSLDQKNVTAWLDLRNKAAHAHYSEYTLEQVELMQRSVADFIARIPLR